MRVFRKTAAIAAYRLRGFGRRYWFGLSALLIAGIVSLGSVSPYPSFYATQEEADAFARPLSVKRLVSSFGVEAELAKRMPTSANLQEELQCMAENLYFEARGESLSGMRAVGHVVMNRVASKRFPDTVCGVVKQGGTRLHRCQFSWWCDGQKDVIDDNRAWEVSQDMARLVFWNLSSDLTEGALWYHADYVSPKWRTAFEEGPTIGRHIFYREPGKDSESTRVASLQE
ncbi:cell wall hydrolase [Kiloniella sp. b19]|uniref:cell wall hydrolase n=1 Tax=Kiloniella sp. GXU_MW_B19 TaxID=3141326 RepID=UPI0031E37B95